MKDNVFYIQNTKDNIEFYNERELNKEGIKDVTVKIVKPIDHVEDDENNINNNKMSGGESNSITMPYKLYYNTIKGIEKILFYKVPQGYTNETKLNTDFFNQPKKDEATYTDFFNQPKKDDEPEYENEGDYEYEKREDEPEYEKREPEDEYEQETEKREPEDEDKQYEPLPDEKIEITIKGEMEDIENNYKEKNEEWKWIKKGLEMGKKLEGKEYKINGKIIIIGETKKIEKEEEKEEEKKKFIKKISIEKIKNTLLYKELMK
jgi:hypothetical protein